MRFDRLLNWAERRTFFVAGAAWLIGLGIGHLVQGDWYGWLMVVPGVVLAAIRPVATSLRWHHPSWQAHRILSEHERSISSDSSDG